MLSEIVLRKRKHRRNENQEKFDKSSNYNSAPAREKSDNSYDSGDNVFAIGRR